MEDLTKKFLERCEKTDLWKSNLEESQRYLRYPSSSATFDKLRWTFLHFCSKYEFWPRKLFLKDKE